ncbi:MAG TPA: IS1595 family transposase, partial [Silvibacterium sp.]|nr:IS1595 family transposase [Silvibacterium sp.]
MESPKTLLEAIQTFSDYEKCREFMTSLRWPDGKVLCPTCGSEKVGYLEKARVYVCYAGHKKPKFSLKVGTVFEDSPIPLEKWLPAVWMLVNDKNGISSWELHRALGVTQKTAWFMLHRIRAALKSGNFASKMGGRRGGPVEVDEAFVGGAAKNMHAKRRNALGSGLHGDHKTAVMGMLDRNTRQVRAKVIPNVKRETLQNEILNNIERKSPIYTDAAPGYDFLKVRDFVHETVTHVEEYVRGEVHTQGIENFWSLLKRGLKGTYVAVEPFHLDRYVAEQVFRYNNRATKDNPLEDADRFMVALSQIVGKRLTYK